MTLLSKSNLLPDVSTFFDDFFDDRFRIPAPDKRWMHRIPAANVTENEKEFTIELAVPGMSKKDFQIKIDAGHLTVSSEKKDEREEKGKNFTRREFSYNTFSRSFILPDTINADKISAKYEEGVLRILLPKKTEIVREMKKNITIG